MFTVLMEGASYVAGIKSASPASVSLSVILSVLNKTVLENTAELFIEAPYYILFQNFIKTNLYLYISLQTINI